MSSDATKENIEDVLNAEREFHNRFYLQATPFDLGKMQFTKEEVWNSLQPMYVNGGQIRGGRNRRFFELMDLENVAGKTVVDLGCGDGSSGVFVAMHGADVTGIDISEVGISAANKAAHANGVADRCNFFVGKADTTGIESESVDMIILKSVLHHFVKYPGIEAEIYRILKPGGVIIFADIVRDNPVYNMFKYLYLLTGAETDYGENISMKEYHSFASRYQQFHYEREVIFESVKRVLPKKYRSHPFSRAIVLVAAKIDQLVLKLLPFMETFTLEIAGSMKKHSAHD